MTITEPVATSLDEKTLIARAQAGDGDAFSPLVRKYHPRVLRHITRRLRDPFVAKDLTQETWLKAYRAIHTFRGASSFYAWLYRIAENVITDHFRRQKHRRTHPLHLIDERGLVDTQPCPSRALLRQELRDTLKNALNCLTKPRRRVFVLYYHHDLPIKAIARRLNRSEGTVKTHLRNARLQLRELLTPYLNNADRPER